MIETLVLHDNQGRSVLCEVLRQVAYDGLTYALLTLLDHYVEILVWSNEQLVLDADDFHKGLEEDDFGGLLEEPSPEDLAAVLPVAKVVLSTLDLQLHQTAFDWVVVQGDLPEPDDDDVLEIALDEDIEEYQLLATFDFQGHPYGIFTPLEPFLFFAAQPADGEPYLLTAEHPPELFEHLHDLIEQAEDHSNHRP